MDLKQYLDNRPALKRFVHHLLIRPEQARPRQWVSWFVNPLIHKRGASARVRRSVRMDVVPFNAFQLGAGSTIEDFSVVNNGVGDVRIGHHCHLGLGAVVIGPVTLGNNIIIAQHVVMSGLNHVYDDIETPIRYQPTVTKPIVLEDDCWIGANVTIVAGVTVGRHSVVAGGSVVTRDVLPFTVVGGNPARVLRRYDETTRQWVAGSTDKPVAPVAITAQ